MTDDSVCFVMEYANGGNLFDLVRKQKRLRETQARWFFQQLILAIDYCHRRGELREQCIACCGCSRGREPLRA